MVTHASRDREKELVLDNEAGLIDSGTPGQVFRISVPAYAAGKKTNDQDNG
jgi:hypothetical protein